MDRAYQKASIIAALSMIALSVAISLGRFPAALDSHRNDPKGLSTNTPSAFEKTSADRTEIVRRGLRNTQRLPDINRTDRRPNKSLVVVAGKFDKPSESRPIKDSLNDGRVQSQPRSDVSSLLEPSRVPASSGGVSKGPDLDLSQLPGIDFSAPEVTNRLENNTPSPTVNRPDPLLSEKPAADREFTPRRLARNDRTAGPSQNLSPRIQPQISNSKASADPRHLGKTSTRSSEARATNRVRASQQTVRLPPAIVQTYSKKITYAKSLARRGAISSATEELQGGLRIIAEAIDQATGSRAHVQALRKGLTALQEAADFTQWGNDLAIFVAGHETEILQDVDLDRLTVNQARQAYLNHAEEQLRFAIGNLPLAAEALRSLAKVHLAGEQLAATQSDLAQATSMLLLRIATSINPQDADSPLELAILYSRYNHLPEAKQLLIKSLQIRNDSTAWTELARVHQALGEQNLASWAINEARLAASNQQKRNLIYWTNPDQFNQVQSMVDPPVMTAQRQPAPSENQTRQDGNGFFSPFRFR